MTQLINHTDDGKVMFYFTLPHLSGTAQFEHAVTLDIITAGQTKYPYEVDDPKELTLPCTCGCGSVVTVPLTGDSEAQEFHARYRFHTDKGKGKYKSLDDVRQSVIDDVAAMGHQARVRLDRGKP